MARMSALATAAIIEREDDAYVALCPELDIASQGDTVERARTNLIEALELFFETPVVTSPPSVRASFSYPAEGP